MSAHQKVYRGYPNVEAILWIGLSQSSTKKVIDTTRVILGRGEAIFQRLRT
jgi:hypothetical protein